MPTHSATLNSDTSTAPIVSVRLRERHSARAASTPITAPAGTKRTPSQGSVPSSAKQPNAGRQLGRSSSWRASSAAPASTAPAVSSG